MNFRVVWLRPGKKWTKIYIKLIGYLLIHLFFKKKSLHFKTFWSVFLGWQVCLPGGAEFLCPAIFPLSYFLRCNFPMQFWRCFLLCPVRRKEKMSTKAFGGMAGHQSQSCGFYFLYSSCSALKFRSRALTLQPREFTLRIFFCTHDKGQSWEYMPASLSWLTLHPSGGPQNERPEILTLTCFPRAPFAWLQ